LIKSDPGLEFGQGLRILGDYAIILLLEGAGNYRNASGFATRVTAGDLIWVFPGQGHAYGPGAGDRWEELYLVFTGSMFDQWSETGLISPDRPIWRADPVAHWQRRICEVIPPELPIGELAALAAAGRLVALLADLAAQQEIRDLGMARHPDWLELARSKLAAGESAAAVARSLSLSYDSFRKHFTAATGLAPAKFQMLGRIQKACTLLRDHTVPIKVIAERTGFADEFHFSKRFRQIVGLPPGRFRDHAK
jgi:AraC-like DNA-binding protein